MDYFGNGKEVATVGVGLLSPADFFDICVFVFLSLVLSDPRSSLVGCWVLLFLPPLSVYNTYIKGK